MIYLTLSNLGFVMGYSLEDTVYKARKLKQGLMSGSLFYKTYSINKDENITKPSKSSSVFPAGFWNYGIKTEKPLKRLYPYTPEGQLPVTNCYSFKDAKRLIQEHIRCLENKNQMKYHPVEFAIGKVVFFKPVAKRITINLKHYEKYTYHDNGLVEHEDSTGKKTKYLCMIQGNQIVKADKAAYRSAAKYGSIRSYDFESESQVKIVLRDDNLTIDTTHNML